MNNKALRLPIILFALMAMVGVIQMFRPKERLEPKPFRDASEVATFDASMVGNNVTINGMTAAQYAAQPNNALPLSQTPPQSWSLQDLTIRGTGATRTLVFRDGSTRALTPTLLALLPHDIQRNVTYDGQSYDR
jgi:hypothetical protein